MTDAEREAVIINLVARKPGIGKVKIQKECYFLQEALGVSLGFEFVMHYYGPYSFELDDIVEELGAKGSLGISPYVTSTGYGFDISLGPKAQTVPSVPDQVAVAINRVASLLGPKDAHEAELWATTHFVHSILKSRGIAVNKADVVSQVRKLKPRFTDGDVSDIFDQLNRRGLFR